MICKSVMLQLCNLSTSTRRVPFGKWLLVICATKAIRKTAVSYEVNRLITRKEVTSVFPKYNFQLFFHNVINAKLRYHVRKYRIAMDMRYCISMTIDVRIRNSYN